MKDKFYQVLKEILPEENIKVNELLKNYTTFKIGGPADYLLKPSDEKEISDIIKACNNEGIPFYIIGNGSNLLVKDKGYRGVIIHISKSFDNLAIDITDKGIVTAKSGIMLVNLAKKVSAKGLTGFEFATGIPGTLGGAVAMNAGAYGGEIKDIIKEAKVMNEEGDIFNLSREQLDLDYRSSIVQKKSYIVLEAAFEFEIGNQKEIDNKISQLTISRKSKQPLEYPSAGSTFKRPDGHFAGKLIMDSGLKGYRVGDIQISEKHCGFVINLGKGTAEDVIRLIEDVSKKVYEQYNVHLEPEIKIIGE